MKLNCSINLHLGFYKMSFQIDNVDQDQTAQTVQSGVDFVKNITLEWRYSGFNHILESFIQLFFSRLRIKLNYKRKRCNS